MRVFLFLLFFTGGLAAQTTNVTATITDPDGQAWANGTWTAQLYAPGVTPNMNGVPLTPQQQTFSGTMNGSGAFTAIIISNTSINPSGTSYRWTICPKASAPCSSGIISVQGASQNLTSALSGFVNAPRFTAGPSSYGYADGEVGTTPLPGGVYYNVVSNVQRIWTGTGWVSNGGGGGGGGTVTNFTAHNLPPLFTQVVNTPGTTPDLVFTASNAAQNSVLAGPASGGAGAYSFRLLTGVDMPLASTSATCTAPAGVSIGSDANGKLCLAAQTGVSDLAGHNASGAYVNYTFANGSTTFPGLQFSSNLIQGVPFAASGVSHAQGLVPDPGASAGTTRFLREDSTWAVPGGGGGGTPGGSSGQLQYNNAGAFGGVSGTTVTSGQISSMTVSGAGGSVLASGIIDGHTALETVTASFTVGTSTSGPCSPNACLGEYVIINCATSSCTVTLPPADTGRQYCVRNATGKTSVIVFQTSGSGQFIDNQGVNTASGGNITSPGSLGDSACVVGASGTQWYSLIQSPSAGWTTN